MFARFDGTTGFTGRTPIGAWVAGFSGGSADTSFIGGTVDIMVEAHVNDTTAKSGALYLGRVDGTDGGTTYDTLVGGVALEWK